MTCLLQFIRFLFLFFPVFILHLFFIAQYPRLQSWVTRAKRETCKKPYASFLLVCCKQFLPDLLDQFLLLYGIQIF